MSRTDLSYRRVRNCAEWQQMEIAWLTFCLCCSYPETKGLAIEDAPKVFQKHWFWKRYAAEGFIAADVRLTPGFVELMHPAFISRCLGR